MRDQLWQKHWPQTLLDLFLNRGRVICPLLERTHLFSMLIFRAQKRLSRTQASLNGNLIHTSRYKYILDDLCWESPACGKLWIQRSRAQQRGIHHLNHWVSQPSFHQKLNWGMEGAFWETAGRASLEEIGSVNGSSCRHTCARCTLAILLNIELRTLVQVSAQAP